MNPVYVESYLNKSSFYKKISERLTAGDTLMLSIVVETHGSSPGRAGFAMALGKEGRSFGSIGGGVMEQKIIMNLKSHLKGDVFTPYYQHLIHSPEAIKNSTGMLCNGDQGIIVLKINKKDEQVFQTISETFENHTSIEMSINSEGEIRIAGTPPERVITHFDKNMEQWEYREKIGAIHPVYIIGGGHVGLALSKLLNGLDFYCIVMDNRADLNLLQENVYAHEKRIVDYKDIQKEIPKEGNNKCIIIMTHNHGGDEGVLTQLIDHEAMYIGMMGSLSKVAEISKNLLVKGITKMQLDRVHAPIGLPIGSETPEEIAVSIAAEIIQTMKVPL